MRNRRGGKQSRRMIARTSEGSRNTERRELVRAQLRRRFDSSRSFKRRRRWPLRRALEASSPLTSALGGAAQELKAGRSGREPLLEPLHVLICLWVGFV